MFLRQRYILNRFMLSKIHNFRINMCTITENNTYLLCKHLDIDECQAKLLQLKQPVLKQISEKEFKTLTETVKELGFSTQTLILNPALFGVLPITLKYRYKVLEECGLQNIKPGDLLRYLNIVKQKTIGQLRSDGHIPHYLNIENRLASFMTQWPTSLTTLIYGGIDIKEIIRSHPKIAMKNFSNMVEIRKILQEFDVSNEAQIRCFEIYTLSPETIRARLENAKKTPEFITYFNHPRFLKMIHHNKKTTKRLINLYSQNKKCVSLNILSGSFSNYETFEKMHGDRLGKAKDLLFCICEILGNTSSASDIRKILRRHPFWLNMPLVQIKYVAEQLLKKFSPEDVFENCTILLYPWNKIRDTMVILHHRELLKLHPFDHLDISRLNDSQKLSLVLYLLEKKHYFTGNGVWTEDKNKNTELTIQTKNIPKSILKIAQN
ncbi:transcription termination factor 5, mitochondrial [Papilio machaon]|uniref:transcription termination factor 5, mitochondrial n=1 Tax=Papilio machaon TaxID=76193 RepID=UPI001E665898|nr:transcription termination factor 5, mitochondrial [Papilio machaon]